MGSPTLLSLDEWVKTHNERHDPHLWAQHMHMFEQLRLHLKERAREARKNAISYRDFRVGSAALGYSAWRAARPAFSMDEEYGRRYWIYTGFNVRPIEDDREAKVCSDTVPVISLIQAKYDEVVALCIAAEPQVDDHTKIPAKTLHPCRVCRTLLRTLPIMRPWTIIYTFTPDEEGAEEQQTFEELLRLHNHLGNGG